MEKAEQRFIQGMCVAVAYFIREGQETLALDVLEGAGVGLAEIEAAEVDEFDARAIIPAIKEAE